MSELQNKGYTCQFNEMSVSKNRDVFYGVQQVWWKKIIGANLLVICAAKLVH